MRKLYLIIGMLLISAITFAQYATKTDALHQKDSKSYDQQKVERQKEKTSGIHDVTPFSSGAVHTGGAKATWDVEFSFDASAAGHPGIETDGTNFYTTAWDDTVFTRYEMDGTNPEDFGITDVGNIRDMAYDGTYFYGSDASMTLYQMDLANETLESEISVTCTGVTGIRHIAYDPELDGGNGGFWIGDWEELGAIDMSGSELVPSTVTLESCYGSAYDPWTDPSNPCLWLFQQPTGAEAVFYQFDINTYSMTGVTHDCSDAPGYLTESISGGACSFESGGEFILVGNIQQDPNLVVGYELAMTADTAAPGAPNDLDAVPDAGGALTADVSWTNPTLNVNGNTLDELDSICLYVDDETTPTYVNDAAAIGDPGSYTVTVASEGDYTFTVVGYNSNGEGIPATISAWVGEDVPAEPTDVELTATGMDASLSWTAPVEGLHGGYLSGTGITYDVIRFPGSDTVSEDQTGTTFTETLTDPDNYYYEVIASNSIGEGGSAISNELIIGDLVVIDFESGFVPNMQYIDGDCGWEIGTDGGSSAFPIPDHGTYAYTNDDACDADMSDVWMILPAIDFTGISDPFLRFSNVRYNDIFTIKVSTDSVSWTDVEVLSSDDISDWQEENIDLSAYAGEPDVLIAFHYNDDGAWGYGWAVDDIMIPGSIVPVSCPQPTELYVTGETTTTADLGWLENGSASEWNIEWGETGFAQGDGNMINVTDNPYELTGLESGTVYDFYVQAVCDSDSSLWSGPFTFNTSCETVTSIPYTEDFESGIACWTIEGINADQTWYWDDSGTSSYEGDGNIVCEYDDNLNDQDEYIISPEFDFSTVPSQIHASFYWKASYEWAITEDNYNLHFEVTTDGGTTWTSLWDLTDVGVFDDWTDTLQIVDISDYSGEASVQFAFHYVGNDGAAAYVDLFEVDEGTEVNDLDNSIISVFPNPANNTVYVENAENAEINILNMLGQKVASQTATSSRETVNISDLSNGTYIIRIEDGNEVITQKLNVVK
ncbi:MAG: choice-of-anchor J domain-containing protein, partial [Bacteroidales bacterium]